MSREGLGGRNTVDGDDAEELLMEVDAMAMKEMVAMAMMGLVAMAMRRNGGGMVRVMEAVGVTNESRNRGITGGRKQGEKYPGSKGP